MAEFLVAKHLDFPDSGNFRLLAAARHSLKKILDKRAELATEEADEFDQYLAGCLCLLRSSRFQATPFEETSPTAQPVTTDFMAISDVLE